MSVTPPARIEAPSPGRLRYGLFTAAPPAELVGRALGGGYVYEPDHCESAHLAISQCVVESPQAKTFDEGTNVEALPFAVYASVLCGTLGYSFTEFEAKARARLAAGEQGAAELALWTGLTDVGGTSLGIDGFNNSSPTTVTVDDPDSIVHVVAALEEFAYLTNGYGYQAFIHAPASVAAFAGEARLVIDDDGLLRTPYGSVWVFGGGYPGTDSGGTVPAGGTALYVTGQVNVWRAADAHVPDTPQTLDRTANQQYVLAEREYAASFDCLLGQATYTFPTFGS